MRRGGTVPHTWGNSALMLEQGLQVWTCTAVGSA